MNLCARHGEVTVSLAFIGRYWRGEGPLWRLYWLYDVLASCVLALLIGLPAAFG
jgi:hypothetical protein